MGRNNADPLPALVEIRHLRYFVAVAEELHFARAARRLNIAQPALSRQIRQLESLLGTTLLVRTTRHVALTPAGRALLPGAHRTLNELSRTVSAPRRGPPRLRVGFTGYSAIAFLPRLLRAFRRARPGTGIELVEDCSRAQLDAVERHLLDVALVTGPWRQPVGQDTLRAEVVSREPFCVALPKSHRLGRSRGITLERMVAYPLVVFPRYLAPAFHDYMMGLWAAADLTPTIVRETAGYDRILEEVAAGRGISLVPESVRMLRAPEVRFRPLTGSAPVEIQAVVRAERASLESSEELEAFLQAARCTR